MSLKRLIASVGYAIEGLRSTWIREANFKVEVFCGMAVVLLGFYFEISAVEWLSLITVIGFVIVTETLNTAIENLCDVTHPSEHPDIKRVKDTAAGAVLISGLVAIVVGSILFYPHIIRIALPVVWGG